MTTPMTACITSRAARFVWTDEEPSAHCMYCLLGECKQRVTVRAGKREITHHHAYSYEASHAR